MSTRVSYRKSTLPNTIESLKVFVLKDDSGEHHYRVYIDTTSFKYYVRDERSMDIVKEDTTTSLHKAKLNAKEQLRELGISFNSEARPNRKSDREQAIKSEADSFLVDSNYQSYN